MMRILATTFFLLFLFDCFGQSQAGRPTVSVDTVADLIARNPVPNERVVLSGWRTNGDMGAQRILRHDPTSVAATNLGCVFGNAGAGRYLAEDCNAGEIDVRWFGAVGDGTTDDGPAINAAIQYAKADKSVLVPSGTYKLSTFVVLTNGTRLFGHGIEKTILLRDGLAAQTNSHLYATIQTPGVFNPYTGNGGHTNGYVNCTVTNIVLRDFTVGTYPGSYPGFGIALFGTKDTEVSRVGVRDCTNHWAVTYLGDNTTVNGLQIRNTGWIYRDGSHMIGGNGFSLANSIIESGDDALAFTGGWALDVPIKNVSVANCVVKSTHGHAIRIAVENTSAVYPHEKFEFANITGSAGLERNGLIYVHSDSTAIGYGIKGVSINGVRLSHGGIAGHGGTPSGAAYGVRFVKADEVLLSDVSVGQTPYRNFFLQDSGAITMRDCSGDGAQTNFIGQTVFATNVASLKVLGGRYNQTNKIDADTFNLIHVGEFRAIGTHIEHGYATRACVNLTSVATEDFSLVNCTLTNALGYGVLASVNPTRANLLGNTISAATPVSFASGVDPDPLRMANNMLTDDKFFAWRVRGKLLEVTNTSSDILQSLVSNPGMESRVDFRISGTYPQWYGSPYYLWSDQVADTTNKFLRFGAPHYTTTEEPVFMLYQQSYNGANWIDYGGGSSLGNAATQHRWFLGTNSTHTTGTNVMSLSIASANETPLSLLVNSVLSRVCVTNIGGVNYLYIP